MKQNMKIQHHEMFLLSDEVMSQWDELLVMMPPPVPISPQGIKETKCAINLWVGKISQHSNGICDKQR